jgi:hypothetical protein
VARFQKVRPKSARKESKKDLGSKENYSTLNNNKIEVKLEIKFYHTFC